MSQPDISGFIILGVGFSIILTIVILILFGLIKLVIKWGSVIVGILEVLMLVVMTSTVFVGIFYGIGRLAYLIIK